VIAGFGARAYCEALDIDRSDGFEICECDDETFDRLLSSVDLAVQLRAVNWGESSGVLARLLSLDIPVIASPFDAFSEYGNAFAYFGEDGNAVDLADLMAKLLVDSFAGIESRQRSRQEHSPARFCQLLSDLISQSRSA
jgi:glycosyltransferase involved in cell wall biosynthesis